MSQTLSEVMTEASQILRKAGVENPRRDARILIGQVFDGDQDIVIREPDKKLTTGECDAFMALVDRRRRREPVSHILGRREFWSQDFFVTSDVLDPRPDSETLIEAVLRKIGDRQEGYRLLDLGTGSGCLLLTLLSELPHATGLGVDFSEAALKIAKKNAVALNLQARSRFLKSDWFSEVEGVFDIILSNPPYIETDITRTLEPEVIQYEPITALDGGKDGLDCYRHIISRLPDYLQEDGLVIFEVGKGQTETVANYLSDMNFIQVETHKDLASIGRCVSGRLKK